jgi:hypothetical protein
MRVFSQMIDLRGMYTKAPESALKNERETVFLKAWCNPATTVSFGVRCCWLGWFGFFWDRYTYLRFGEIQLSAILA